MVSTFYAIEHTDDFSFRSISWRSSMPYFATWSTKMMVASVIISMVLFHIIIKYVGTSVEIKEINMKHKGKDGR